MNTTIALFILSYKYVAHSLILKMYGSLFKCVKLSTFKKAYFDQVCIHMNLCRIDYKPKLTQIWLEFASKERIKNVSTLCVFSYLTKFVKEKISFHSRYLLNNVLQFKEYEYLHFNNVLTKERFTYKLLGTEKLLQLPNR